MFLRKSLTYTYELFRQPLLLSVIFDSAPFLLKDMPVVPWCVVFVLESENKFDFIPSLNPFFSIFCFIMSSLFFIWLSRFLYLLFDSCSMALPLSFGSRTSRVVVFNEVLFVCGVTGFSQMPPFESGFDCLCDSFVSNSSALNCFLFRVEAFQIWFGFSGLNFCSMK